MARTAAAGISGTITIGFIRGYEQSLFSETLRGFHEAYPNISIELIRENMSRLYGLLEDGLFERDIPLPAALFAGLLWNPETDFSELLRTCAQRSDVTLC